MHASRCLAEYRALVLRRQWAPHMSCVGMASAFQVFLALAQALAADDGRQMWEHKLPADWVSASMDLTPDQSAAGGDEAGVAVTGVAAGCVPCTSRPNILKS